MRTRSCGQQGHGSANIAAVSCARGGTSGEGNPAMGRSEQMSSTHSKRNIPAACHAYKRFRRGNTASRPRPPTRWRVRGVHPCHYRAGLLLGGSGRCLSETRPTAQRRMPAGDCQSARTHGSECLRSVSRRRRGRRFDPWRDGIKTPCFSVSPFTLFLR